jgi:hypothetical protein
MSKMFVIVEMSVASGGQRDRAVVVALRARDESGSWDHSAVVCIRRQVALFAQVRSSIA